MKKPLWDEGEEFVTEGVVWLLKCYENEKLTYSERLLALVRARANDEGHAEFDEGELARCFAKPDKDGVLTEASVNRARDAVNKAIARLRRNGYLSDEYASGLRCIVLNNFYRHRRGIGTHCNHHNFNTEKKNRRIRRAPVREIVPTPKEVETLPDTTPAVDEENSSEAPADTDVSVPTGLSENRLAAVSEPLETPSDVPVEKPLRNNFDDIWDVAVPLPTPKPYEPPEQEVFDYQEPGYVAPPRRSERYKTRPAEEEERAFMGPSVFERTG